MKAFMDDNFLLENDTAKLLYHDYAKEMPIFDYHCHLTAKDIAENKSFSNLTEIWLSDDHYKWRALRSNGVPEKWITGSGDEREKFQKWAETVPYTIGNPLYHWTHLELQRYFDMPKLLSGQTADEIWEHCNRLLQTDAFTARELIKRSNVKGLCTTDDPLDDLTYHKEIKEDLSFDVHVLPTFRPDGAIAVESRDFSDWIAKLEDLTGIQMNNFTDLVRGLHVRVDYFHEVGCRLSDHGLDSNFYSEADEEEVNSIFLKGLSNEVLSKGEIIKYKTAILKALGKLYKDQGWAMQLHIGALRSNNTKKLETVGPNTGFDSIADFIYAEDLSNLLNSLDYVDTLPKTIIYNLNPRDNYMVAAMIGNFQDEIPGKIQFGSAWWFGDQRDGMEEQLKVLANCGLLSKFVGMLTDSRSFLSYTRHEYFRRILCNMIGRWVENGEYPADFETLEKIVKDICYFNIDKYLDIES
ncbi:glucuronate isomerase [Paenisporosarcina antarctica]|uniref:Uronate isomerase n=1 Tax=Paenisporosarcina antarctica TaxID=417367 RepID=A0A4P7A157_9BACL|nr:glucuronate isomerase [Paenisporosarcina antarctica]QBP42621.1 glucuronate isomerase [Paenisporosarcina antarctica]